MKIHFVVFICYFSNLRRGWYFKEEKVDLVKYYLGREVQIRQSGSSGNPFSKLKVSSFAKFSLPLGTAVFCLHLGNIRNIKLLTWICEQSWSEICDILASAFNILNICVIFDVRGVSLTCPPHFKLHEKKNFSPTSAACSWFLFIVLDVPRLFSRIKGTERVEQSVRILTRCLIHNDRPVAPATQQIARTVSICFFRHMFSTFYLFVSFLLFLRLSGFDGAYIPTSFVLYLHI